jgi:hypothetical protein
MAKLIEMLHELRAERARAQDQLHRLDKAISVVSMITGSSAEAQDRRRTTAKGRKLSADARRRISQAQKRRWARQRQAKAA